MTKYDIWHDQSYRANPESNYHGTYQAMINRLFAVFIALMIEVLFWSYSGFTGILMSVPMVILGGLCLYIIVLFIAGILSMAGGFIEWVRGY